MILMFIILVAMLAMAKPRRKRPMGRYIRGNVQLTLPLTTLAANTLVSTALGAVTERTLISSLIATWTLRTLTVADNVGPIKVGVSHSDYTDAEVEQWIEQSESTSWAEADKVAQEISRRKIRRIGVFEAPGVALGPSSLRDGKEIKTKLNWILTVGQTVNVWAYNMGSSAVATTVPDLNVEGHANLWPR